MDKELSDVILDSVTSYYGILEIPYQGPSFILPDGKFLDLRTASRHSDVEYYLDNIGLSLYGNFNRRSGSPTLKKLGCIRVNTSTCFVQLSSIEPTKEQYYSLLLWLNYLRLTCLKVEVIHESGTKTFSLIQLGNDEVLDFIKNLYK